MRLNETELKVSPLLATPDEAKRDQRGLMLAQCVGVSGVPNEARVASFPASTVGVNEANQGQMGPRFRPPHRFREGGNLAPCSPAGPLALLGEGQGEGSGHPAPIATAYERDERK